MAYACPLHVAALTPHIINAACDFTASTNPTSAEVEVWLSSGCAIIEAKIGSRGYGAIPTNSPVYELARGINTFYAAWMAELSTISARVDRMENTRDERFKKAFDSQLAILTGMDLSVLGVSRTRGYSLPYSGGLRITDKDANDDDGDTVQGRFQRGQMRNPEAQDPVSTTTTSAS